MIMLSNYTRFRLGKFLLPRKVILLCLLFFGPLLFAHPYMKGKKQSVVLQTFYVMDIMTILKGNFKLRPCFEDGIWVDIRNVIGSVESVNELESRLCFFFDREKKNIFDEGIKTKLRDIFDKNKSESARQSDHQAFNYNSPSDHQAKPFDYRIPTNTKARRIHADQPEEGDFEILSRGWVNQSRVTRIILMLKSIVEADVEANKFDECIWGAISDCIKISPTVDEFLSKVEFLGPETIASLNDERKRLNDIFKEPVIGEPDDRCQPDFFGKSGKKQPRLIRNYHSCVGARDSRSSGRVKADKPMIYLYPEIGQEVLLSVEFDGVMTSLYPEYNFNNQWRVWAEPDGTLKDPEKDRIYYGLYWEGEMKQAFEIESGFVIAGSETAQFLEEKLKLLGLNDKEANEMIVYWLPRMQGNAFNLIQFQTVQYADQVPLNVHPKPDAQIRIMMLFKPLDAFIEIQEQALPEKSVERKGFVLVEWGGSEIKASGRSVIE